MTDVKIEDVANLLQQRIGEIAAEHEGKMALLKASALAEIAERDRQIEALQEELAEIKGENVPKKKSARTPRKTTPPKTD